MSDPADPADPADPTVRVWRLVKRVRAVSAFDGEGAFRFGGRWNSKGQRVVYASRTLALALLEILVHIDPSRGMPELVAIPIEIPSRLVGHGPHSSQDRINGGLPWPLQETRHIGDRWLAVARQPTLQVPSAIIPLESNILINPAHLDFGKCQIGEPEALPFDPRLYCKA
jgi:RES domain-containing protein